VKPNIYQEFIHVVIGILKNTKNEVLVARRRDDAHLGGLLEFPGGKLEANESPEEALERELKEELNIQAHQFSPLIQIPYSYQDRRVVLDVYTISDYSGSVIENESQPLDWKDISALNSTDFPSANHGIIRALQLPKLISVTPEFTHGPDSFMTRFENVVKNDGVAMIHLRSHELNDAKYMQLAAKCLNLCRQYGAELVLNRDVKCLNKLNVAGLHLTSKKLLATAENPIRKKCWVSASCHSLDEVLHASKIGLDYIFLGPVIEKNTNTNIRPLGWDDFRVVAEQSLIPVYAIGGLSTADVDAAIKNGGQGIAAIRDLWK
jgi:8-oxo-dGTP diphosphatase